MEVLPKNPFRAEFSEKITLRRIYGMTSTDLHPPRKESLMREKSIEQKLTLMVKKQGGICPKFVSPSFGGMPDRLVLLPDGLIAFVELKAPGKRPRPLQEARHQLLHSLGFKVYVIEEPEQFGGMLDELQAT